MGLARTEPALTPATCEAGLADTLVVVGHLDAVETVGGGAGVRETLVNVSLASFSGESWRTIAAVSPHSIHTGAIVLALGRSTAQPQRWSAVVFIDLAEDPQRAGGAGADVMSHQINASASVLARMGLALIDLYLAVLPSISWHTVTLVPSNISSAGGAIAAGFVFTVVHLAFAIASSVISWTLAIVGIPSVDTVTTMVAQLICLEPSLASSCLTGHS